MEHVEIIQKELSPRETEDLLEIWQLHEEEDWTEEAFEAIRLILQERLGYVPAYERKDEADRHINQAQAFVDEGEFEKALEEADQAIECASHYAEAYSAKGSILDQLDRLEDAMLAYQKALTLNPDLTAARKALRYVSAEMCISSAVIDMQPFRLKRLYTESWVLLFQNRSLWIFGLLFILMSGLDYLSSFWRPLVCISSPITLLLILFATAAIILVFNNLLFTKSFSWEEVWKSSLRNIMPLGILLLLSILPILVLLFLLVVSGFLLELRFSSVTSVIVMILFFAISILATNVIGFSSIEKVVFQKSITESIRNGIKMIVQHPGKVLLVNCAEIGTGTLFLVILTILGTFLNHISISDNLFSMETLTRLNSHPLLFVLNLVIGSMLNVWHYVMFVLMYHWIQRQEPATESHSQIRLWTGIKRQNRA